MMENRYTDGSYLRENPDWGAGDAAYKTRLIVQLLRRNSIFPAEVIEVGCGSGAILSILAKDDNISSLKGYDISPQAIAMAKSIESNKMSFFNEDITLQNDFHTDLLLVVDVLEHLENFYSMLAALKNKSNHFIFHIPLDLSCRTLLKPHVLLQQRQSVGHIHYFTKQMVEWMLNDAGYQVVDWLYSKSESDRGLDRSLRGRAKRILRGISYFIHKDLSAKLWGGYSMMILAK